MYTYNLLSKEYEHPRTKYLASQNIIPLGTLLLDCAFLPTRNEGDAMMYSLSILLLFVCPLLILLTIKSTHMAWYYKFRRWIWHRRLIKKIEKELNARKSNRGWMHARLPTPLWRVFLSSLNSIEKVVQTFFADEEIETTTAITINDLNAPTRIAKGTLQTICTLSN